MTIYILGSVVSEPAAGGGREENAHLQQPKQSRTAGKRKGYKPEIVLRSQSKVWQPLFT